MSGSATKYLPLLLLASGFAGAAVAVSYSRLRPQMPQSHTIRSESDLVVLPVTVTTRNGQPVENLTQEDFRVYENGQVQKISEFSHRDVPVTAGLVVDSSGSMRRHRTEVVEAAKNFLQASNPQDQVFVVNFNERVFFGLPAGVSFTSNVTSLEEALLGGPSSGLTALYDAIIEALRHMSKGSDERKALIVISDGGDNASTAHLSDVLRKSLQENAIIYTIGILSDEEADVQPAILKKIARATGGRSFFPQGSADLPQICKEIAAEIREQYVLAYVPANQVHDGTYHAIRVSVTAPREHSLHVRTRSGYFAPSSQDHVSTDGPEHGPDL